MKLSPFVIGVISAQGSGDYDYGAAAPVEEDRHTGYYGDTGGSTWTGMGSSNWNYGSSGRATDHTATAVTCWESNNMGSHNTHHNHFKTMTDEYGWANDHHGHKTSVGTINIVNGEVGQTTADGDGNTIDYHSALAFDHRLSGCIYEVTNWDFNALTYNQVHTMTYGTAASGVGYDATNGNIFPVWWHYFNAHTVAGGNTNTHRLIMANPTYEGLGYLNFIVTFLRTPLGVAGTGDADRNPTSNDHNTNDDNHTDLYSNGEAFTLSIHDDASQCQTYAAIGTADCYASKYQSTGDGTDTQWTFIQFAISSFPHNDLGKDFRFNLRMMHHLGEGDSSEFFDSYYFYRVNTITITFPTTVSCPYEKAWDSGAVLHKCMDSAGHNGHHTTTSIAATTGVHNQGPMFTETLTDSLTAPTLFPKMCSATAAVGMHSCGQVYAVSGLMNMYDEYMQQEYGTHQEIWFQFYYKYVVTQGETDEANTFVYNYPNKLFNAFEIVSILGTCDATNLFNKNQCLGASDDTLSEESWSENVQSGR